MALNNANVAISNFHVDIDGASAGYLSSFQPPSYETDDVQGALGPDYQYVKTAGLPKIGDASAVFHITQSLPLLDWIASLWKRDVKLANTAVHLADQNYKIIRSIEMMDCLATEVAFPDLKAADGKKAFDVTCKWKPSDIAFTKGGGSTHSVLGQRAKPWLVCNYDVHAAFGLNTKQITSASLPKISAKTAVESFGSQRFQTPMYSSIEFSTIKLEIGRQGYDRAEALALRAIKRGEIEKIEEDIIIDMLDPTLKKVLGTFTMLACTPKKFEWSPKLEGGKDSNAICTLEFLVQDFRFEIKHK